MKQINTFFRITAYILFCTVLSACGGAPAPVDVPIEPPVPVQTAAPTDELDGAIREASTYLNGRIPKGSKVVFLNIRSDYPDLSEYILSILSENAVNDGVFSVVDRQQLDMIRAELDFQMSGEVSDESAQSIGKMLGAEGIVSGTINKIGPLYRVQVKAIEVQTAGVQGQWSRNIPADGATISVLAERYVPAHAGVVIPAVQARTQTAAVPAQASAASVVEPVPVPVKFTVTFNANGANGRAPSVQTVQSGESISIPDNTGMTPVRGAFDGWNTSANGTGTPHMAGEAFTVTANTQLFAQWKEKVYQIGDRGPAGGIVFYDKGVFFDGWRYLEVAPADLSSSLWHSTLGQFNSISGIGTAIGAGKQNTQLIVQHLGREGRGAAKLCSELVFSVYDDWFLPSKDELELLYTNLKQKGMGGFLNTTYWSSSQNGDSVWYQNFTDGNTNYTYGKREGRAVRAIRQF